MSFFSNLQNLSNSQKSLVGLSLLAGGALMAVGIISSSLSSNTFSPEEAAAGTTGTCKKVGMNFAINSPISEPIYKKLTNFSMGYSLEMANDPGDLSKVVQSMKIATGKGIIPIFRPCSSIAGCNFKDASIYAKFLNDLGSQLGGKTFYALAGPNEPISENWLGGVIGDPKTIVPPVAAYMNKVIAEAKAPNLKLLTPAFNITHPKFSEMISEMKKNNANFAAVHAFSGNIYNINSARDMTFFNAQAEKVMKDNGIVKPIIYTESGMLEKRSGVDPTAALDNFRRQLNILKANSNVEAILIFNGFGQNNFKDTDGSDFLFNKISDEEYRRLLGQNCVLVANTEPTPITPQVQQSGGTAGNKVCGETCARESDCKGSTAGAKVTCSEGRCQNQACLGKTVFGSRCDCDASANTKICGQPCGVPQGGLCGNPSQDGNLYSCRNIDGPSCKEQTFENNSAVCVPNFLQPTAIPNLEQGKQVDTKNPAVKLVRCTNPENVRVYVMLKDQPSNLTTLPNTELTNLLCNWCGNYKVDSGEQCDAGPSGSTTCNSNCKRISTNNNAPTPQRPTPELPRTNSESNNTVLFLISGLMILFGVYSYRKYNI